MQCINACSKLYEFFCIADVTACSTFIFSVTQDCKIRAGFNIANECYTQLFRSIYYCTTNHGGMAAERVEGAQGKAFKHMKHTKIFQPGVVNQLTVLVRLIYMRQRVCLP